MTLDQAKRIMAHKTNDGIDCPLCEQFAKIYKRKLNAAMAASLIKMWKIAGTNVQHIPTTMLGSSREEGKLAYWGLVAEETTLRADGGRAGYWAVTDFGEKFIHGAVNVYSHAQVYNGRCLGFTGVAISIKEALGIKFDYRELMSA